MKRNERPTQRHIVTGDVSEDMTWHSTHIYAGIERERERKRDLDQLACRQHTSCWLESM